MNLIDSIAQFISTYFFQILGFFLSLALLFITWFQYRFAASATLSAHFKSQIMPVDMWHLSYTGLVYPGEEYLDLILSNSGPGVAKSIQWELYTIEKQNEELVTKRTLPYLGSDKQINVEGYIKRMQLGSDGEIKYFVKVYYKTLWGLWNRLIIVSFNSKGTLIQWKVSGLFGKLRVPSTKST